jgi:hypothetical protein
MREHRVKVRPVTVTVAYRGEVLAGNGRTVFLTGVHLSKKAAEDDAMRWVNSHPRFIPRLEGD